MVDNAPRYGFRLYRSRNGKGAVVAERMIVATAQTFPVNGGAATPLLRPGDLVRRLAGGGAGPCDGSEGAGGALAPYAVVVGIGPQWDGVRMEYRDRLASGIAWGTNLERQSTIFVIPVAEAIWEVDVDDIVTATTKAAYQAFIGENCDHINTGAAGETSINPKLDISLHGPDAGGLLIWRIVGVSDNAENRDYAEDNVKLLVVPNLYQDPASSPVGI